MNLKEQKPQETNDQDVDFEPLINWFLGITTKITGFINFVVKAVTNHTKTVLMFVLLGIVIGLGVYFFAEKKYSASIQLATKHTSNLISNNMIKSLTRLANDKSFNNLSATLDIPIEDAKQISAILYLDHNYLPLSDEDTVVENKPFFIYLETHSPNLLINAQKSLINYLEKQPLTTEYRERERFEITSKIKKNEVELKRLDSLKLIVAQSIEPRAGGNGFIYGEPINPVEIYQESERIYNDYLSLTSRLKALKSVKTISNFMPSEKPIFPRIRHLLIIVGAFFLLGIIVAFRMEAKNRNRASS